jgi:hypothetical protein
MSKQMFILTAIFALILISLGASSDTSRRELDIDFNIIGKMSNVDLFAAITKVVQSRNDLENNVVATLASGGSKDSKLAAMLVARFYRLEGTVRELVANIDFVNDRYFQKNALGTTSAMWGLYPACDAIDSIGIPAVPALLDRLANTDDQNVRERIARCLDFILGDDSAKFFLQQEIQRQIDAKNNTAVIRLISAFPLIHPPS